MSRLDRWFFRLVCRLDCGESCRLGADCIAASTRILYVWKPEDGEHHQPGHGHLLGLGDTDVPIEISQDSPGCAKHSWVEIGRSRRVVYGRMNFRIGLRPSVLTDLKHKRNMKLFDIALSINTINSHFFHHGRETERQKNTISTR